MLSIITKEKENTIAVSVGGTTNRLECMASLKTICKVFYKIALDDEMINNESEFKLALIHLINELNLTETP